VNCVCHLSILSLAMSSSSSLKKEATPSFFESLYVKLNADANEIVDGLFLGAAVAGEDGKAMLKKRITHVLICHPTLKEFHPKHFKYGRAPLADTPEQNVLEHLPDALEFMGKAKKSGGRIFVCCMKGISRSSSVVISWLMIERGITFEEAFKIAEKKRPVVYPNVGFQQQLRFLDKLIQSCGKSTWEERLNFVRFNVPLGSLDGDPLHIRDKIGESMTGQLDEAEALAEKVFAEPQLLQQRELWKRLGLFFENFHKYKALPSDPALLDRAKAVMERLRALPKIFSDSLKGVKLALAVASEIESWAKFAEPAMADKTRKPPPTIAANGKIINDVKKSCTEARNNAADADAGSDTGSDAGDSSTASGDAAKGKKGKKDEKISKKDKKKLKKQKKLDKKQQKIAKKAEKIAAKMEKAAKKAEGAATGAARKASGAAAFVVRLSCERI